MNEKSHTWAEEYRASAELAKELAKTQLEHIKNTEARQQIEHEQAAAINTISLRDNDSAAKREWQRHCVAVALAQGLLMRPYGVDYDNKIQNDVELVKRAHDLAELMMQEREARK